MCSSLVLSLLLAGCGGAVGTAPCKLRVHAAPEDRVFTGESNKSDEAEAKTGALVDAFVQAASELGVRVTSEQLFKAVRTSEGDQEEFLIVETAEAVPVEFRGTRRAFCREGDVMRAKVAIPAAEWSRIVRVRRGRTALIVDCKTEPEGVCGEEVEAELRKRAVDAGLAVATTVAGKVDAALSDTAAAIELGARHEAAFLLLVTLRGRLHAVERGVMYAYANASASLVETSDGKVLQAAALENVKGAHFEKVGSVQYGPVDAVRKAIGEALEALGERMGYWRR